ncbi:MAG: DUF3373 family protein [Epsilonproteobacteria bacterium]|nr:DUF3373 family protein [Campylobacterota bacterium]
MLKVIVLSIFVFSLVEAQEVKEPTIRELMQEIRELKRSVAELKSAQKENKELKQSVEELKVTQKENKEYIEEVEEFTENTETKILQDKVKFGLGFKTELNNFTKEYASGRKVKSTNVWSNKLMLNLKADITENMKFNARLSMYKYWGSSYTHSYSRFDNMQGRVPADSSIYVERAYLDWFFNKDGKVPMAITIGRQPSSDGPSHQLKDNITRKATYSALLYDGAADGLVFTLNLSKILDYDKTFLRFGYAKGFGYSESANGVGNAYVGASNSDLKDTNIYGIFFDTTLPFVDKSLVQLSYSKMKDIIANPLDSNTAENSNIGDMDIFGAMVEMTNVNDMNLDMFLHYGYIKTHPNSNSYRNYGGLLNNAGSTASKTGSSVWVGGRYGMGEKGKYKIGLEYNHGSKNWINLTQGSFDVYNKLATRGDAYEAYLMYVINRYTNIRLGYIRIDYDYTGSGWFVGESIPIDSVTNKDFKLKMLQSIYLKLNVNF